MAGSQSNLWVHNKMNEFEGVGVQIEHAEARGVYDRKRLQGGPGMGREGIWKRKRLKDSGTVGANRKAPDVKKK